MGRRVYKKKHMIDDTFVREQLCKFLKGGEAFMPFADAVKDFPEEHMNTFPTNVEYTFWHLLEHIRITQWDIVDFCKNKEYKEIQWPNDYWPAKDIKATKDDWKKTVKQINNNLQMMIAIVQDPQTDLSAKIPWGNGQIYLREALLVAEHNAYHIGELAILRQVMSTWPEEKKV